MSKRLVIYLQTDDSDHPSWEMDGVIHQDDLAGLRSAAKHRRVIVAVPGEAVLLLNPTLPEMSRARLKQAIPFAVEEQLIDDIETYHFAMADRQADGAVPVAVIATATMQAWCARLSAWHITPHVMIPLTLVLPYSVGEWHAYQHHTITVRTGRYTGFTCEPDQLEAYLAAAGFDHATPRHIHHELPRISHEEALPLNLLQGPYATHHTSRFSRFANWRTVFYLAVVWLGVGLLGPLMSYVMLSSRLHTLTAAARAISQTAKRPALSEPATDSALLVLGYISQSFSKTPGITFKKMAFARHEYVLTIRATTQDALEQFTHGLTSQGLQVQQEQTTFINGRLNTVMRVR